MNKQSAYFYGFLALALGLVLSAIVFSTTWKAKDAYLEATGSAKKRITSDIGILKLNYSARAATQSQTYAELKAAKLKVLAYLKTKGINPVDIVEQPVTTYEQYETTSNGVMTNIVVGYNGNQFLEITSKDVNLIKQLSLSLDELVSQNITFSSVTAEYYYSKLAETKVQIQSEAAKDAAKRAAEIATATGRSLGPMVKAKMGVLQITPPNSNAVQDYGINDVSTIEKEVTAVVSASFVLD